jgi:hypothetical protein
MVDGASLGGLFRGLVEQLPNADVVAVIDSDETGGVESIEQLPAIDERGVGNRFGGLPYAHPAGRVGERLAVRLSPY